MNKNKLQVLISMGVFSAALLSGAAYADDKTVDKDQVQVSSSTATSDKDAKPDTKKKTSDKSASDHACGGANGCGGK